MTGNGDHPTLAGVRAAAERVAPFVHRTPVLCCRTIDRMVGGRLYFKCENFQKGGAFKFRGASNAIGCLSDRAIRRGVATHSSGNHAAAVALAAAARGVPARVVMPDNAPRVKRDAVAGYGAEIVFCRPDESERERVLDQVLRETGAQFIHPYDDDRVIEGQGTAALELLQQVPDLDLVMTPVGGGGLISGTAIVVRGMQSATRVIGVEPAGADDAYRSFVAGRLVPAQRPVTIADGLLTSLSQRTFGIISSLVDDVSTVDEESIAHAMRTVWERMKVVIEPSAAVPLAAILAGRVDVSGVRTGIIISGGNVDLDRLPWSNTE